MTCAGCGLVELPIGATRGRPARFQRAWTTGYNRPSRP